MPHDPHSPEREPTPEGKAADAGRRRETPTWKLVLGIASLLLGSLLLMGGWESHLSQRDGDAWLAIATSDAQGWAPDAQLVGLKGSFIEPSGRGARGGLWFLGAQVSVAVSS